MKSGSVDLRPQLLPVRNQGPRRPACLVFSSSAAHEHRGGFGDHLSVEYLFYHAVANMPGANPSSGVTMDAAARALATQGQPVEVAWPYAQLQPTPWAPPLVQTAIHKATMNYGAPSLDAVVSALEAGRPVILGLIITEAFYKPDLFGRIEDRIPDSERGGHAVLAVGCEGAGSGALSILVRNSWGKGWGHDGHAWISEHYLKRQLMETAVLI